MHWIIPLLLCAHIASAQTAKLVLERSNDGLKTWQTVATSFMLVPTLGESTSVFRMRIEYAAEPQQSALIQVNGGTFPQDGVSSHAGQSVGSFIIGKYEVTKAEWDEVLAFAIASGYDLEGVGSAATANHPVASVGWKDVAKWCNAKSEMEGRTPVYTVSGATFKRGNSNPTADTNANGYRLPTSAEWEWAFRGGDQSLDYTYSGGNSADNVAWFSGNSGGTAKVVGLKFPNELGLHDMSGNLDEWCWDSTRAASGQAFARGGYYWSSASECVYWLRTLRFSDRVNTLGFRLARNAN